MEALYTLNSPPAVSFNLGSWASSALRVLEPQGVENRLHVVREVAGDWV